MQICINREQVEYLRSLKFSWSEIGSLFGVSRMTLFRRRQEWDLLSGKGFTSCTNEELNSAVTSIKALMPDVGEQMVQSALVSRGIKVSRKRLKASIHEVDPINTALRWSSFIVRRPYSVPGSNSLWHLGIIIAYIYIYSCNS